MTSESNIGQYQNLSSNGPLMNPNQMQPPLPGTTAPPPPPHMLQGHPPPPPQAQPIMSHINTYPQPQQPTQPSNSTGVLIISNVPSDLTSREATLIFALVIDEILSIEMKDYKIYAQFKNINTCITTGKLLEGKYIFGTDFPPIKVEYDNNTLMNSPTILSNTQNAFNQLRLSSGSNISPPSINNQQLHHQGSNQSLGNGNTGVSTMGSVGPVAPPGPPPPTFDMLQKRQSVGNQRSRFVFSDPFSQEGAQQQGQEQSQQSQQSQQQQQQSQQQQQQQQSSQQQSQPQQQNLHGSQSHSVPGGSTPTTTGPGIDLSDLTGKSILLMESQNDAREYENLVRDTWDTGVTPLASAPGQAPGVGDWNNAQGQSNGSGRPGDNRRTSFFNTAPALHTMTSNQQQPISNLIGSQIQQGQPLGVTSKGPTASVLRATAQQQQQSQHEHVQQQQSTSQSSSDLASQSVSVPQQSTSGGPSPPNQYTTPQPYTTATPPGMQPQSAPQHIPNKLVNQPPSSASGQPVGSSTTPQPSAQSSTSPTDSSSKQSAKDIPDLSLLARVPPPANPADQNPPCNTLYVGNLPPDATEAELRTLFSPQKGFRRLSFRTKTQSSTGGSSSSGGHSHGPMCFVEFESIAHATRALADLYGSALPRPGGGNGKGGIRLSFSKNPLGVRGPGNPRRQSTNQVSGSGSASSGTSGQNQSGNGVGNYGYSNYHQK